ncbi:hypothetical protein TNCV_2514001 [Trichonephila clavipes]|nr:hypothetical protein TNCV_2514001 [Trichonephila clavipes]
MHRCPTRRVFRGTGLKLVTIPATIRYLDHLATVATWGVMSSSLVPLKTSRVKGVEAQTSSRWWGVEVRENMCELRCRPHYLTMVQKDEVQRQ